MTGLGILQIALFLLIMRVDHQAAGIVHDARLRRTAHVSASCTAAGGAFHLSCLGSQSGNGTALDAIRRSSDCVQRGQVRCDLSDPANPGNSCR